MDLTDVAAALTDPAFPLGAEGFGWRYESLTNLMLFSGAQGAVSLLGLITLTLRRMLSVGTIASVVSACLVATAVLATLARVY